MSDRFTGFLLCLAAVAGGAGALPFLIVRLSQAVHAWLHHAAA